MRAEMIAYMIYSEGPEYPEYVMHFFPKVFRDPQISEYVRQIPLPVCACQQTENCLKYSVRPEYRNMLCSFSVSMKYHWEL